MALKASNCIFCKISGANKLKRMHSNRSWVCRLSSARHVDYFALWNIIHVLEPLEFLLLMWNSKTYLSLIGILFITKHWGITGDSREFKTRSLRTTDYVWAWESKPRVDWADYAKRARKLECCLTLRSWQRLRTTAVLGKKKCLSKMLETPF